jgi:hypothetical protein
MIPAGLAQIFRSAAPAASSWHDVRILALRTPTNTV